MTSMVISVEAELSMEAIDTIVAAMNPATTRPISPGGSSSRISRGYTMSDLASRGNNNSAHVPGSTITNRIGSLSSAANRAPQRA